jgi:ankyrin repeat protein
MKHLLLTTIAAVVLVGCGESQQSAPAPEATPVEPVAEAAKPEPTTAKAPDISILIAAAEGNIEAVKQHIAAGTDVGAKTLGETPLHWVSTKEVAELLIDNGADVNMKNSVGLTPLDWAVVEDSTEIADLLRKHGGKRGKWFKAGESIYIAAKVGHIEAVKQHIAAGTDVNAKDEEGLTPLYFAAGYGYKEIVELLIGEGADVNVQRGDGKTPLDRAIRFNRGEMADLLRKHGAKTAELLKAEGK